ncbi:MAG: hypothetical protein AAF423_07245 [Pseudomonadota bacterium]
MAWVAWMEKLLEIIDAFVKRYNLSAFWLLIFFGILILVKIGFAVVERLPN